ncbi:MAG: 16S rRNA (cytosine(1402)-N(4))-methyltransferase RsmH [Alphaproteobacteria bacterium]|nr:16S rRNA (cytosine(1402)-N(4))-methyltransferase RsmH [Alphaproteobacteria bacterium]
MSASPHIPVLAPEVVELLQVRADGLYIDGTFGAGGYTAALLAAGAGRVIAIDRDPNAIRDGAPLAARYPDRLRLVHGTFGSLDSVLDRPASADGIALDLGVSSMQLDQPDRGFSFQQDGPLDMRMSGEGPTAADLVATTDEAILADWLWRFGEERYSRRVARAIVATRHDRPLQRTADLAAVVAKAIPRPDPHHHPATRTFQALRIVVNDELGELERGLAASERALKAGGRCAVVSFHSLEDRIVKAFFRDRSAAKPRGSRHLPDAGATEAAAWRLLTRRPVVPGAAEIAANPRARSARLRAAERLAEPETEDRP